MHSIVCILEPPGRRVNACPLACSPSTTWPPVVCTAFGKAIFHEWLRPPLMSRRLPESSVEVYEFLRQALEIVQDPSSRLSITFNQANWFAHVRNSAFNQSTGSVNISLGKYLSLFCQKRREKITGAAFSSLRRPGFLLWALSSDMMDRNLIPTANISWPVPYSQIDR